VVDLSSATNWRDISFNTPPSQYNGLVTDGRYWWHSISGAPADAAGAITCIPALAGGVMTLAWQITETPTGGSAPFIVSYSLDGGGTWTDTNVGHALGSGQIIVPSVTADAYNLVVKVGGTGLAGHVYGGTIAVGITGNTGDNSEPNCECESVSPYKTLLELRTSMMRRLGYSAMASNPPAGMPELLTEFLQDAQQQIYNRPGVALRTRRFFKWTMVPGTRFYDVAGDESSCQALDPLKIEWVGVQDLQGAWYHLTQGIQPEFYTTGLQVARPSHYEIRSCIEIFPPPADASTLWIKGDFGLGAFSADSDRATIDDHLVFLLALGNAKAHYKQRDANMILTQAGNALAQAVAGRHMTARYIPGSRPEPPPPRPYMTTYIS
jgi:hypothetical protein